MRVRLTPVGPVVLLLAWVLMAGCVTVSPKEFKPERQNCEYDLGLFPADHGLDPILGCYSQLVLAGCDGHSIEPGRCIGLQCTPPTCPQQPVWQPYPDLLVDPAAPALAASAATPTAVPAAERAALIALYNATGGPTSWFNRTHWLGAAGTECTWHGITCDAAGSHVTQITLDNNNPVGHLPSELGNLAALEALIIQRAESLTGSIPSELGKLKKLRLLVLQQTMLSGSLPSSLGGLSSLDGLKIASSDLSGTLPATLGNLPRLRVLQINASRIGGPIPAALGNLKELLVLDLRLNELTGAIPADLGRLTKLHALYLGWNSLSGAIPAALGNLPKLTSIDLNHNRLTGAIPSALGNLPALESLILDANQLTGPLPDSLGSATKLDNLSVGFNSISGPLPAWLPNLAALRILYLPKNKLTGPLIDLSALHQLTDLHLAWNALDPGPLPAWLAAPALPKLARLDLARTRRTGPLADLTSLPLTHLSLAENPFDAGPVPTWVGNETSLKFLDLSATGRNGTIPGFIAQLDELGTLFLSDNPLTRGPIPAFFNDTDMPRLANLGLDGTQRTGRLPKSLFTLPIYSLSLARNQLTGKIPKEVRDPLIHVLDLSHNRLGGALPQELGTQVRMESLRLNGNKFTGEIPAFFKSSLIDDDMVDGVIEDDFGRQFVGLDLRHNALKSSDPEMLALLKQKHKGGVDFRATQTVAPTGLKATALDKDSIKLTWTKILFSGGAGGYVVEKATKASGPFAVAGTTTGKGVATFTVNGLKPATDYYFRVKARTAAHAGNPNVLTSSPGPVVKARTK